MIFSFQEAIAFIIFPLIIFLGFFAFAHGANVEFDIDTTISLDGVQDGDIKIASSSKAGTFEVASSSINVDGIPDGSQFIIKTTSSDNGLKVGPSGGNLNLDFNTSNYDSNSGLISKWTLNSSITNTSVNHTVAVGSADSWHDVLVDGSDIGTFQSDSNKEITFNYTDGFSEKTFEIKDGEDPSGGDDSGSSGGSGGPIYPQSPFKVKINEGDSSTNSSEVQLTLITGGGVEWSHISNSKDFESDETKRLSFDGTGFDIRKDFKDWNLCFSSSSSSCLSDIYTVYVRYESFGGIDSKIVSDSIELTESATDSQPDPSDSDESGDQSDRKEITSEDITYQFSRDLSTGSEGADVKLLQKFLNNKGFEVAQSGVGSPSNETNYFGTLTKQALITFQNANKEQILEPVGLQNGTGYFGPSTREFINNLSIDQTGSDSNQKEQDDGFSYTFSKSLEFGDRGGEVRALQQALDLENCFNYSEYTGYFGPVTKEGIVCFQEKYQSDVLAPWNLQSGTGYFGSTSIEKMNELY